MIAGPVHFYERNVSLIRSQEESLFERRITRLAVGVGAEQRYENARCEGQRNGDDCGILERKKRLRVMEQVDLNSGRE